MRIRNGYHIGSSLSLLITLISLSSPNSSSSQELFGHPLTLSASAERSSFGLLSDNESGFGASISLQYDLSMFFSIFGRVGYGKVGNDNGIVHFENYKDAYVEIFNFPLELGGSFYFGRESLRPYVSLARAFHHVRTTGYVIDYMDHAYRSEAPRWDYSASFSETMGFEAILNHDLIFDIAVTQYETAKYGYFLFRAGFRYILLR